MSSRCSAIATVAHALVTAVRRRRRDLALLKTLGFTRRQVSASVAWQATTFGVLALLVGIPVGIVIGRWAWTSLADDLGTVAEPIEPVLALVLGVPLVLLIANAVAFVPGRIAAAPASGHGAQERVMGAVVMLARSELRRRWRSVVVLTLLVAFIGAVVVALLGGARRTETSLARFEERSRAATLEIDVGETTPEQLATLRRVPGVDAVGELYQLTLVGSGRLFLPVAGQVDSKFGDVVDRAAGDRGAGRRPDPGRRSHHW